jgi:hypothetical protein
MIKARDDAGLQFDGQFWEKAAYDMGNSRVMAQADGCGAISRYAIADRYNVFVPDSFYGNCSLSGQAVGTHSIKEVYMLGRRQRVYVKERGVAISFHTFLDAESEAVFQSVGWEGEIDHPVSARLDFGMLLNTREMAGCLGLTPYENVICKRQKNGLYLEAAPGVGVYLACSQELILREIEGAGVHLSVQAVLPPGKKNCLHLIFKWVEGAEADGGLCTKLLSCFDAAKDEAEQYEKWLSDTAFGETALAKAEAASCLNCAISNYKTADHFLGFFAGVHYQSPARTYYRDSFFTVLPLIKYRPGWVRNQLVTLAVGIGEDGSCPSAVKSKGIFWPNHLDSPSYFILLLHAYVEVTCDAAFLEHRVGERTMLGWARLLSDALLARADLSGLIYRPAGNRHDWADNVFREGYVCYEQALFCQAMRSMGKLLKHIDQNQSVLYTQKGAAIAQAIESNLWLEGKGWYANYRSPDHLEDNLSIDTALLAWFGIARPDRARRMLAHMEMLLETRLNAGQPFGDWGVMCCWPKYKYAHHLVEKSSYPYVYHNGSDWPFWSCVYALAKRRCDMEWDYPATRWFTWGLEKGWCTPVEYVSPLTGRGSLLQGWSAMGALALDPDARVWEKIWDSD